MSIENIELSSIFILQKKSSQLIIYNQP